MCVVPLYFIALLTDFHASQQGFGKFSVLAIERSDCIVGSVDVF